VGNIRWDTITHYIENCGGFPNSTEVRVEFSFTSTWVVNHRVDQSI